MFTKTELETIARANEFDRERRVRLDRINASGVELLEALRELAQWADQLIPYYAATNEQLELAEAAITRAQILIEKLEAGSTGST